MVSVGRLLAKMGLSRQRPLYRAYQQDGQKVRRWKEEEYPAIAARVLGVIPCERAGAGGRSHRCAGRRTAR